MATFTNKTPQTPLGIGALSLLIEPGQSVTVSVEQMHKAAESPVVQHWVKTGMLEVVPEDGDAEAAQRLAEEAERKQREAGEAEELRKLEAAEEAERKTREDAEAAAKATSTAKAAPPPRK